LRRILSTTDRSQAESLLIALDAHGIEAIVRDESGSSLPFIPVTVAVVDDADFERAIGVLHNLQPTSRDFVQRPSWFRTSRLLVLVALLALVLVLCFDTIG
jgi:hypothetical protein